MHHYTFPVALLIMKHSNRAMRSIQHPEDEYLFVRNGILMCIWNGEHVPIEYDQNFYYLSAELIMDYWVEVEGLDL
jgi:hypothetical protein